MAKPTDRAFQQDFETTACTMTLKCTANFSLKAYWQIFLDDADEKIRKFFPSPRVELSKTDDAYSLRSRTRLVRFPTF